MAPPMMHQMHLAADSDFAGIGNVRGCRLRCRRCCCRRRCRLAFADIVGGDDGGRRLSLRVHSNPFQKMFPRSIVLIFIQQVIRTVRCARLVMRYVHEKFFASGVWIDRSEVHAAIFVYALNGRLDGFRTMMRHVGFCLFEHLRNPSADVVGTFEKHGQFIAAITADLVHPPIRQRLLDGVHSIVE
jgi:hypothetical protein